ncbi:TonB system transport protein ExbD [Photobacterium halotolerans]|uniref:TonB system transport protein ExbD n=1 Tax=Photobacterium halotolerans TaxID=265726 RepID=UPI0013727657|nr:TonB system transport protein ExbD [Photobacterium halotolerans]NAX48901.1 TonB system transport protein ExbD [Photobacterium halotolerans]
MAFNISNDSDELAENHDINVTPFIDVMLVLLIIFMVAAPLSTVNIPVDLPSASAEPQPMPDKPFYLTVQKNMTLTLGEDNAVELSALADALHAALPDKQQRIYLRADQSLTYEQLMQVMNRLGQAGYLHIALIGLEQVAAQSS